MIFTRKIILSAVLLFYIAAVCHEVKNSLIDVPNINQAT